jgi:hypothetical protein
MQLLTTTTPAAWLPADNQLVSELFAAYDKSQAPSRKKEFFAQMRTELATPVEVDEDVFYPALSPGPAAS